MYVFIKQARSLKGRASFTLIELLIVTTLLAVLGAVVVVVLNPAEMFRQSRDSQRLVDLNQLNKVLSFIQVDQPALNFGSSSVVYVSIPDASSTCANLGLPTLPSGWSYACSNSTNYKKINGLGWVPVDFTLFSAGSPISKLPIDPVNATSTGEYYTYVAGGSWKLTARLVSKKYTPKAGLDSGSDPALFEQGNDITLAPFVGGMVGYWTFDETGTTANDSSGYGNNGTMYSSSTITDLHASSGCKIGSKCASFDGVDDYVSVTDPGTNSVFDQTIVVTLSTWLKPTTMPQIVNAGIVGKGNNYFMLFIDGLQVRTYFWDGSTHRYIATTVANINANNWYHIVTTYQPGDFRIYIDGIEKASSVSITNNMVPDNSPVYIASDRGYANRYFWGQIDDLRIYNRALSAAEISAIYNATK